VERGQRVAGSLSTSTNRALGTCANKPVTTPSTVPQSAAHTPPGAAPAATVSVHQTYASPYDDPDMIYGSEVEADYDGCYAWLDNAGSGNLVGVLDNNYDSNTCEAELYRDNPSHTNANLTGEMTASSGGSEATGAVHDTGYTMRICVWAKHNSSDVQCSSWYVISGASPAQQ
jgi:hypothetical protein